MWLFVSYQIKHTWQSNSKNNVCEIIFNQSPNSLACPPLFTSDWWHSLTIAQYQLLITFIIVSPFFAMRPRCAFAAWITTRNNMNHKTHNGNGTIAGDNNHNTRQQHCIASFVNLSVPRLAKSQNKKSVRTWFTCELVCFFNTVFFLAFSVCLRIRCTLNRIEWTEL